MQVTARDETSVDSPVMAQLIEALVARIREKERAGLTRYRLALMTGVSQSTLSRLVAGQLTDLSASTIERLAEALELDVRLEPRKKRKPKK